jgi:hypothetical protein
MNKYFYIFLFLSVVFIIGSYLSNVLNFDYGKISSNGNSDSSTTSILRDYGFQNSISKIMENKNQEELKSVTVGEHEMGFNQESAYKNIDMQLDVNGKNRIEKFENLKKRNLARYIKEEKKYEIKVLENEIENDQKLLIMLKDSQDSERTAYIIKMLNIKREKLNTLLDNDE